MPPYKGAVLPPLWHFKGLPSLPFGTTRELPSLPFGITRDCPPSLLVLQGNCPPSLLVLQGNCPPSLLVLQGIALPPFWYYKGLLLLFWHYKGLPRVAQKVPKVRNPSTLSERLSLGFRIKCDSWYEYTCLLAGRRAGPAGRLCEEAALWAARPSFCVCVGGLPILKKMTAWKPG